MLPAKNCEKRKGISGRLSSWHIRSVIGVSVIVTMSGMSTVIVPLKTASAQKSPTASAVLVDHHRGGVQEAQP